MPLQKLQVKKDGTIVYTLDNISELESLPKKGIDTGSIAMVYDNGGLKIYWFTRGKIITNYSETIEEEGTWNLI